MIIILDCLRGPSRYASVQERGSGSQSIESSPRSGSTLNGRNTFFWISWPLSRDSLHLLPVSSFSTWNLHRHRELYTGDFDCDRSWCSWRHGLLRGHTYVPDLSWTRTGWSAPKAPRHLNHSLLVWHELVSLLLAYLAYIKPLENYGIVNQEEKIQPICHLLLLGVFISPSIAVDSWFCLFIIACPLLGCLSLGLWLLGN